MGTMRYVYATLVTVLLIAGCSDSESETPATTSTIPETPATTSTIPETIGSTWSLPQFDGSVSLDGSVSPALPGSRLAYDDLGGEHGFYLLIDGAPAYSVVDWICLAPDCERDLTFLVDGSEFVWVVDGSAVEDELNLSDGLHHALRSDAEALSACWSDSLGGPVVSVIADSTIDRAWVFIDGGAGGTWFGLDASTLERDDVLPLPFGGYDIPTC